MSALVPLPPVDREAFALPGDRASVLLLHGFTSTPWEMRAIGDHLSAAGFACHAPRLPGHGTRPEDLDDVDERDWLNAARAACDDLAAGHRFVIGASMGGLLALSLAAERGDIAGIGLLAPALSFFGSGSVAVRAAAHGLARPGFAFPKGAPGGDVGDPEARRLNPTYPTLPSVGMAALERARQHAISALRRVECPVYVAHGQGDRTIHPRASRMVAEGVRAPVLERHLYPRSRHILAIDADRDDIARGLIAFLGRCLVTPW